MGNRRGNRPAGGIRGWLGRAEAAPNLKALSLFRILFGLYLLAQFASVIPYYNDLYGEAGVMPLAALADQNLYGLARLLPVVRALDAAGIGFLLHTLLPLSLVAFMLGYRTRWAGGIALALECYLNWRNPVTKTGAETLAWLLLLWSLFLPLNRYWSIDAALDRKPRRRPWPTLPFAAMRLQIASLYFFSALFKLEGEPWQKGYGLLWTLQDTAFAATPAASFFVENLPAVVVLVNYLVIAFQLAFPYLIYSPWRNEITRALAIAGSALMHLSFVVFMYIGPFPYICLVMLMLLVPDRWIDRLRARRRERLQGVAIYYEPGCVFCEKVSRILREFFLVPEARVRPASANREVLRLLRRHNSWVVVDPQGRTHLKWRAMAYVLAQCIAARPLASLTDLAWLRPMMARLYDCIGAHRRQFGVLTRWLLPFRSDAPPGRFALTLNGTLMALALLCNLVSLDQWSIGGSKRNIDFSYEGIRNGMWELFALTQVHQDWALFSPIPTHFRWSFAASAFDIGGKRSDIAAVMPFLTPGDDTRANRVYWALYFSHFLEFSQSQWTALSRYMCSQALLAGKPAAAVEFAITITPVPPHVPHVQGTAAEERHRMECPASS
jgi:Vitamin K-dependent gamma-carboxylase